jgi:osmotically-inducible protein OsmY
MLVGVMLFLILFLQGCADMAMSGAQAVYNRRSLQKNMGDQYITLQAYKALNRNRDFFDGTNISITTYNRDVLLAGQVPEVEQRKKAEALIKFIPNINEIYNSLDVSGTSSTLIRMSDAWITTKIKAKLLASDDVDGTQIKVVTENGTVYLMGILSPSEADAAFELASETDGVNHVVKFVKYMRITKT